ncbi:MAG: TonB-dependent receptor [Janthinobacterium lividum]
MRGVAAAWLLWLLLLSFGARTALAQGQEAAVLRGRVVDTRGLPVAGATVRVRPDIDGEVDAVATAAVTQTDRHGGFVLLGLSPGEYRGEVLLQGSQLWLRPVPVILAAGEIADFDLRLRDDGRGFGLVLVPVADGEDAGVAVDRAAGAPAAKTAKDAGAAKAAGGGTGGLGELPVEDRQWESVEAVSAAGHDATLAGGGSAQGTTEDDDTATVRTERETGSAATGLSFDGLPATQNAQTVDGLSAEQGFSSGPRGAGQGGGGLGSSFAQGAVRSVRVMPRTFSAQYGGAAGGVVTVQSRSAEARLHGSVFAQTRESGWAATNPFSTVTRYDAGVVSSFLARPDDATRQYGGAVGLPVRLGAWKAGVFGSVEEQVRTQTLVSAPATSSFFALSATQTALLGTRGVRAGAVRTALDYLNNLMGTTTIQAPRTLGFARLDAAPGARNRVSFGVGLERQSGPVTGGGQVSDGVFDRAIADVGTSEVQATAYTASWEHNLGARATNSLRFQFAHDLQFETPHAPAASEPAIGPGGYAPQVAIGPEGFTYGTPASLGRVAYPDEQRMEAADSIALRIGRQVITMGGDWSRLHDRVLATTNLEGAFSYDSGNTGGYAGGLVDWITDFTFGVNAYPNGGCPSVYAAVHYACFRSYSQGFTGAATEFVTHQFAGFAEDSVRLRRDLLLTVGARYDYLLLPFPQQPNVTLDTTLLGIGGPAMGTTNTFPEDRNNVGPRVSVAWMPGSGAGGRRRRWLTVQAGYGMFYGRLPGATINAALADTALPSSTTHIRITPKVETDCPQVANQGFGFPCSFLSAPSGVVGQTTSAIVFSKGFRLPAVQRATFAVEREVGHKLLLRGEYATAWTTQLPGSVDLNIAPSTSTVQYVLQGGDGYADPRHGLHTGETFVVPLYTARRTTSFGPVTALVSNANATFHSGTAEARLQDFHGWGLRASYTYAKAIDYGPQSSPTPRQDGQFDPFSNGYDKGISSLDFPNHFAGDVTFRSEGREGSRMFRAVAGGWRFAAIGTAGSGAPYSYVVFGGTRLSGGHESINGSGGATYLPTVGRNTLRLPRRGTANLRAAREVPLHGKLKMELRADAFNVLNSVNLSRVETRAFLLGTAATTGGPIPLIFQDAATIAAEGLTTPAFGTPLSSTSGLSRERQIEVGARLNF